MSPFETRIQELIDKINYYSYQYYQEDRSEISDFEFDTLLQELIDLEKKFPELKRSDSPTQRVGGMITSKFLTIKHRFPMLSLSNTYSEDDLLEFDERVKKSLQTPYEYLCELKFDGVALSMTYENGSLKSGVTRGDGEKGDDITQNIKTIRTLPLRILDKDIPELFEVRGEGFLPYESFKRINEERKLTGEDELANPRNAASGTFKMQDSSVVAQRKVNCYVYSFLSEENPFSTQEESLIQLKKWGFEVSQTWKKCSTIQDVLEYIAFWNEKRHSLPLATDGIVIKINSFEQQEQLGFTSKSPRWAVAYKYKAENIGTELLSVDFQVGRTGAITPVANLKAVQLAGTTVKRATLHNINEINRLDLRIGDTVFVEKGGEIIPKITGVDLTARKNTYQPIRFPKICPECATEIIRKEGEAHFYCPNETGCTPQLKGKIEHFVSRKAMNVDSLGEDRIDFLFEKNKIKTIGDLYDLTYDQILGLEKISIDLNGVEKRLGLREKTAQNMINGIEESKKMPFEKVLFGLGIRYVGETVAKKLAHHFKNIEKLSKASAEELLSVPEIGERIAESVISFFKNEINQLEIKRLINFGLCFEIQENTILAPVSSIFKDKTLVVSGVFQSFEREELKKVIESHGGKILSSISSKLDFLVAGENMGPAKLEKAKELNINIIDEITFKKMIE